MVPPRTFRADPLAPNPAPAILHPDSPPNAGRNASGPGFEPSVRAGLHPHAAFSGQLAEEGVARGKDTHMLTRARADLPVPKAEKAWPSRIDRTGKQVS